MLNERCFEFFSIVALELLVAMADGFFDGIHCRRIHHLLFDSGCVVWAVVHEDELCDVGTCLFMLERDIDNGKPGLSMTIIPKPHSFCEFIKRCACRGLVLE